ncbi:MAG: glycosyltransferase family 9 protein [Candidatus Omnitrophica bacterium]|nr:glycosyltransferase family 9 protein [Candidatus Omnitrophota bacterium]
MNRFDQTKNIGNFFAGLLSVPLRIHKAIFASQKIDLSPSGVKRILLIKFWGIGNITTLLPVIKEISLRYSDSEVYFLTLDSNKGLLDNSPYVSKVLYLPLTTHIGKIAVETLRHLFIIRRLNIDLLINFEQCNKMSVIFCYLTGSRGRVGFSLPSRNYNSLYTASIYNDPTLHVSRNFINLARVAGVAIDKYIYVPPYIEKESMEKAENVVSRYSLGNKRFAVFHIGSGENFIGKRWHHYNFSRLADYLIYRFDINVVYTGKGKERGIIESALSAMRLKALNFCDYFTIQEFIAFVKKSYLFVGNDSGPLHIAAAMGVNTVGIYGPMNPVQYGSLAENSLSLYKPIGCNPCLTDLNNKTSLCSRSRCLDMITAEEIIEKVSEKFFKDDTSVLNLKDDYERY